MKSCEEFVAPESDYFIYSPSKLALDMFLYPTQCGLFSYLPGYQLTRESFDSFLLMYIQKGELNLTLEEVSERVTAGHFVLLDCYKRHSYSTSKGWECIWCHFDGITARAYYNCVVSRLGNVFSMTDSYPVLNRMTAILKIFYGSALVQEPLLSKYLTDILTELASRVGLSQYHFIRSFKKETGFTPHEYLVNTRIATAKYLLKNTRLPVKDICFASGFSSESVFCGAFKKNQGTTPVQYRTLEDTGL